MMTSKKIRILPLFFLTLSFLLIHEGLRAQGDGGWRPLAVHYPLKTLGHLIIPRDQWKPLQGMDHPIDFSSVPPGVRDSYIAKAEELLHASWPALPATTFLEYKRTGNRSDYEALSFKRRKQLAILVLAEAMERKGRFLDQIINGIWAISEESFWGAPAHLFLQKAGLGLPDVQDPVVDLFAAETASEMAWTYYLLHAELDKVNPLITKRIVKEEKRRILMPYLNHEDWSYLGFTWKKQPGSVRRVNNWNPWINSNVLAAAALLIKDSTLRVKIIYKTMESIDNFVLPYPRDGGSDEGPEYWGRAAGSLLDYLELLQSVSGGRINGFEQKIVRNMGQYIYKVYIAHPYFFNYGDADAKYEPDPALLYRFGRDTRDSLLIKFAAFEAERQHWGNGLLGDPFGVLNRAVPSLLLLRDLQQVQPEEPLPRDVWMPDIQVMAARSVKRSSAGFYLAAKGGNNGVSHNHNDAGNYIVFFNGRPVLIDAGAQTYTAQTFSGGRYQLWNNQSGYHNLPDINGVMQHEGAEYGVSDTAYAENGGEASLKMNIATAYPKEAGVISWDREITLHRQRDVTLSVRYQLKHYKAPSVENFLTPLIPRITLPGTVELGDSVSGNRFAIRYDQKLFKPVLEVVHVTDGQPGGAGKGRMQAIWGDTLYRVRLRLISHALKGHFVLKITRE